MKRRFKCQNPTCKKVNEFETEGARMHLTEATTSETVYIIECKYCHTQNRVRISGDS